MRAIQCCVCLALLLMTASAVPASSKGDSAKVKKITTIAAGGVKSTSATTATTATASRPSSTLHSSSSSSIAAAATSTTTVTAPQTAAMSASTTLKLPTTSSTTIVATATTATATATATTAASPSLASSTASLSTSRNPQDGSSPTYITETSPRIISPTQHTAATVLSSRKSAGSATAAVADVTTTSPLTAKETRESPGKIRPQIKLTTNYTSETGVRLPEGASAALAKPTKYHYYPHNQHIYLLPECAVQQVCNAVYVRLNFTQPLCACPGRYRDPCSASLDSDDLHTTELVTDPRTKALTLVKTCEPVAEMRECRASRDWSLLALQNVRTGKSHYLVICRCPDTNILEGPMSHDQPTYASVPGIRVYGMMCVQGNRRGRPLRYSRSVSEHAEDEKKPRFPWDKVRQLMATPSFWE
ncbi:PREDICTED: uncharacterized serine-rich protein C215.13 [Vollenhovia emeryi]|uniref:uncharacterized serine-rich protein C215.13 n=1 Tax=Vollenhovia emeryi TaxID=411798 RepID=UPI0005F4E821|nr:PREDICTED: uncharacterized serine-rich protein C215.13 [Vollenhovia emeryi]